MLQASATRRLAQLEWATPDADLRIAKIARVSAPENEANTLTAPRLVASMIRRGHWSPLEMANLCIEVWTTRDIGRQILRHSSLKPQEFSQRYAEVHKLGGPVLRQARRKHPTDRQQSVPLDPTNEEDQALQLWWQEEQQAVWDRAVRAYNAALQRGLARECARVVLPEGNTPTRMYFNGYVRDWLWFCALRRQVHGAQHECAEVAAACWQVLEEAVPVCAEAFRLSYLESNQ